MKQNTNTNTNLDIKNRDLTLFSSSHSFYLPITFLCVQLPELFLLMKIIATRNGNNNNDGDQDSDTFDPVHFDNQIISPDVEVKFEKQSPSFSLM